MKIKSMVKHSQEEEQDTSIEEPKKIELKVWGDITQKYSMNHYQNIQK